jgi:class 3 adenylate cyclase
MIMLVGEPGIGKTRAAQELETYARMRGAQVLWGRAHESSGAPPYWPWMQVGDAYNAARGLADLGPDMQGKAPFLGPIFPWVRQQPGFAEPEPLAEAEATQFRLFDAFATFVRAMSNQVPLLIALDDLHWADKPSLLMLEYVARELARMRVLIVCTYRDTDLSRTHPLSEALAVLNREAGFQRVVLRGLSRDEVAGYIHAAANVTPKPELLDRIFEETEGNPFFLSEVVNLLTQEGKLNESVSDIAVPDGVREALGRRLDRISEEANELLQVAAVVGREFAYDMLTLLGDRDEDALLRLIEEALGARVIEEMEQPGRYRFTHALMQETLLDELSTTRRVRIHGQVGEALERRWGARADERATRLAVHFVEAAMLSPRHAAKAVRYSKLAAQQAEAQSAWDAAARHYEHCLTYVSEAEDNLGEDEAALLMSLGICARNDGAYRAGWRAQMRAITVYRQRGDGAGVARGALEAQLIDAPPERHIGIMNEALAGLREGDAHLEARLLAIMTHPFYANRLEPDVVTHARQRASELAETHSFEDVQADLITAAAGRAGNDGDLELAIKLNREAHERNARLGRATDAGWNIFWSGAHHVNLGRLDEGRAVAEEGLAYARSHHIRLQEEICNDLIAAVLLGRCDFAAFDAMMDERPADRGYLVAAHRATRAEMAGDFRRAVELLPDPAIAGGQPVYLTQLLAFRARIFLNAGNVAQAAREFAGMREALTNVPFAEVFDGISVAWMPLSALDEAVAVADEPFLKAMMKYESRGGFAFDVGSRCATRILGDIALRLGQIDEAERCLREALEFCERERLPIEAGRCLQSLAEVAERRGDRAEALSLLDRAAALFREHGAKLYLDRVIAKKLELQGVASSGIYTSIDAVARAVETERPALPQQAVAPDGTVTIMFSDIEDSTVLTERLGDQAWMELLRKHDALIRKELRAYDGFEVKTIGDAFMVAFQSAKKGLDCAIAIQKAFDGHDATDGERVKVRIGLHAGEAIKDGDDFYGKNVILASRVAGKAVGGEILVSSLLRQLVESSVGAAMFGDPREVELKGLSGTHTVFAVAST